MARDLRDVEDVDRVIQGVLFDLDGTLADTEPLQWQADVVFVHLAAGAKKALIVVNHVVSEQSGMRYCAEWLKPMVPEVPVEFVASKEPFWVAPS